MYISPLTGLSNPVQISSQILFNLLLLTEFLKVSPSFGFLSLFRKFSTIESSNSYFRDSSYFYFLYQEYCNSPKISYIYIYEYVNKVFPIQVSTDVELHILTLYFFLHSIERYIELSRNILSRNSLASIQHNYWNLFTKNSKNTMVLKIFK